MITIEHNDAKKRSAKLASFLLGAFLVFLAGCSEQSRDFAALAGSTMGTTYHITVVERLTPQQQNQLKAEIDQRLQAINQSMSTYIADSELSQLNRAEVGVSQSLSPELLEVLTLSEAISELSSGAFDITVGPLVNRWGFGPDFNVKNIPEAEEVARLLQTVGYRHVQLNHGAQQLLRQKAVSLDLSAIAKGYGVDKVAEILSEKGYNHFLVEIGGEIRVAGLNKYGKPWRIGIETPVASLEKLVQKAVPISDIAVATSGDYRNYIEVGGKRYSHTIDPRTGYPVEHNLVSVTVLDPLCAKADALATAFSVMGHEQALLLANSQSIPAFFIIRTDAGFQEFSSETFKQRFMP